MTERKEKDDVEREERMEKRKEGGKVEENESE